MLLAYLSAQTGTSHKEKIYHSADVCNLPSKMGGASGMRAEDLKAWLRGAEIGGQGRKR